MINKKSSLAKRMQVSYETKESDGGSKKGVLNYRKLDTEVEFFKVTEGKNRINIIPYTIKTKNHPLVKKGEFEVGDKDYVMDYYVHKSVGPTESSVLCLKNTFGKPCPICELQAKLRKEGKDDEAKALRASRRVAYNVEDLKEPGKVKVFETSHYLFEKELIDEARDDEENGFVDFADEKEGKEIKFRASKVNKGGMEFLEFKSFGFEDRDEEISSKILKQAISFDEILTIPTYEEAEKILYGADDEEEEDDEKSSKKSKKVNDDDEDDEDDEPKSKVVKKSKSKSDDDEDEEENDDEEVPSKKSSKSKDDDDEEENDEEEQEDDEEEEKPESSKKSSNGKCPFGHKFGVETDDFPEDCDKCDCWDKCCSGK